MDGSDVRYNNWVNLPDEKTTCGHILKQTGFQWKATDDCNQELNFVCQFGIQALINPLNMLNVLFMGLNVFLLLFQCPDFGRGIACEGQNATLQCGSGQVIEVEDAFYGRKTVHYCRSHLAALPTSSQEECSWINVMDSVTGVAHHKKLYNIAVYWKWLFQTYLATNVPIRVLQSTFLNSSGTFLVLIVVDVTQEEVNSCKANSWSFSWLNLPNIS